MSTLLDPGRGAEHVRETGRRVGTALGAGDVLLYTGRTLRTGADAEESLTISRAV